MRGNFAHKTTPVKSASQAAVHGSYEKSITPVGLGGRKSKKGTGKGHGGVK